MKNIYGNIDGDVMEWETPDIIAPLDTNGVIATLNAVLGIWSVDDAARAVGLTPQDLVNEAQAWAAAQ